MEASFCLGKNPVKLRTKITKLLRFSNHFLWAETVLSCGFSILKRLSRLEHIRIKKNLSYVNNGVDSFSLIRTNDL